MIREEGAEKIKQELPGWLTQVSEKGSGDDITLGLVVRTNLLPQQPSLLSRMVNRVMQK
jgi:hypothetical protein